MNWSATDQTDYVTLNGTGTPPTVRIGQAQTLQLLASVVPGSQSVDIVYLPQGFDTPPAQLSTRDVLNWSPAQQEAYLKINGTGTPLSVTVGPALPPQPQVKLTAGAGGV